MEQIIITLIVATICKVKVVTSMEVSSKAIICKVSRMLKMSVKYKVLNSLRAKLTSWLRSSLYRRETNNKIHYKIIYPMTVSMRWFH